MIGSPSKVWWYPYDFLNHDGIFIGYKAPTRICELALDYPEMIESKMEGKYKLTRFRYDNTVQFLPKLVPKLRKFVEAELHKSGHKVIVMKKVPEYLENGMVRLVDTPVQQQSMF